MEATLAQSILTLRLPARGAKAIIGQALFVALALIIPSVTHRLGLSYAVAQPMHWMILFAALSYGPLAGAVAGLSVPLLSSAISGMPLPMVLPLMIPELVVYGLVAGALKKKLSSFGSVAVALVAGKLAYLGMALVLGRVQAPLGDFVVATWAPGLVAMISMIVALPLLSGLYIKGVKD